MSKEDVLALMNDCEIFCVENDGIKKINAELANANKKMREDLKKLREEKYLLVSTHQMELVGLRSEVGEEKKLTELLRNQVLTFSSVRFIDF